MSAVKRETHLIGIDGKTGEFLHYVKVPRVLKAYREGVNVAFWKMASGKVAELDVDVGGDSVTVEFKLSKRGQSYLDALLDQKKHPEWNNNKKKIFTVALAWASTQPKYVLKTKV